MKDRSFNRHFSMKALIKKFSVHAKLFMCSSVQINHGMHPFCCWRPSVSQDNGFWHGEVSLSIGSACCGCTGRLGSGRPCCSCCRRMPREPLLVLQLMLPSVVCVVSSPPTGPVYWSRTAVRCSSLRVARRLGRQPWIQGRRGGCCRV